MNTQPQDPSEEKKLATKNTALATLKEERRRRRLEEMNRDFARAIDHYDEIEKISKEANRSREAVREASKSKAIGKKEIPPGTTAGPQSPTATRRTPKKTKKRKR